MTLQHPHAELSAYIDGELIPAARAAVDGHLAACGACRAHVAQLRATAAFVHALPDPVPSRRLVPRLAATPAWLAPLRTIMTLASGTAVFLFIASSLVTNITFLAGTGAPAALTASESTRDRAANAPAPAGGAQPASTSAPAGSPNAAFAASSTAPQVAGATRDTQGAATTDDAAKRSDQSTAAPVAPGAAPAQDAARSTSLESQRSPLLDPWLWLALALLFGAGAIVIQRRLRASV